MIIDNETTDAFKARYEDLLRQRWGKPCSIGWRINEQLDYVWDAWFWDEESSLGWVAGISSELMQQPIDEALLDALVKDHLKAFRLYRQQKTDAA